MFRLDLNLEGAIQRAGEPIDAAQWEVTADDEVNEFVDLQKRQFATISVWKNEGKEDGPTLNKEMNQFMEKLFRNKFLTWLTANLPDTGMEENENLQNGIYELILNAIDHRHEDHTFIVSGLLAKNGVLLTSTQSERDFDPHGYVLNKKGWFYYAEPGNPMQAGKGFQRFHVAKKFYVFFDKSNGVFLTGIYVPFDIEDELEDKYKKERAISRKSDAIYGEIAAAVGYEFEDTRFKSLAIEDIAEIRRLVTEKRPDLLERFENVLINITLVRSYERELYFDASHLYEEL